MANAKRDDNYVPTIMAVSNVDGTTPVVLWADPVTHRLLVDASGGGANTALSNLASVAINTALLPGTSDLIALGSATKMWSDLFLGDGAVINFNNGNAVVTHSVGILTVSTGDLRVTTAGTNPSSVVTVGGTQTLTAKTLTAPTVATSLTGSYLTASELLITDASKNIVSAPVATYPSLTELTYLKGVTSAIQTQLGAKMTNPMTTGGDVIYGGASGAPTRLANGSAGQVLTSAGTTLAPTWETPTSGGDVSKVGIPVNNQVGVWTGDGTIEGDAALTFDTVTDVLSTVGLNLSGLTASEIVATDASKNLVSLAVATYPSLTELTYVKGVTSALQTQINAKAPSTAPTFATSITGSYLTASEILITDASKNIVSAPVATYPSLTELTYVKGVTSAIQTQLDAKQALDADLTAIAALSSADSNFIVGSATGWVAESGATARTSLGLGTGDSPQFTGIELGHATDTTLSRSSAGVLAVEGVVIPSISSTNTLTNKRVQPRILSAASYTTDTGTSLNIDNLDIFIITAQAGALLFNAPSGTLAQGEKLIIRIKDNGTARALTWNAVFRAMGTALPSTTVVSKTLYLGFFYNSTDTKWDLVASAQES